MANMLEIICHAREQGTAYFEKFASLTNEDKGNRMVTFCMRTTHTRKVNDWGRDRDTDQFIGLSASGWVKYTHKIETGAGPTEILDPNIKQLTDEEVQAYLESEQCTNDEFIDFMSKAQYIKHNAY